MAWREESDSDFARGGKGGIGSFHSFAVCLYPITLRR